MRIFKNFLLFLSLFPLLFASGVGTSSADTAIYPPTNRSLNFQDSSTLNLYLPLVTTRAKIPLMTGIYPAGTIQQSNIDEIKALDAWVSGITSGRSTSIIGTFMPLLVDDVSVKALVETPLTTAWNNGYTVFVNLSAAVTMSNVAGGSYDRQITSWAKSFKNFAADGQRFAYIAPFQEMNGEWVSYSLDPANYILAYRRIRSIFTQVGVPTKSVKWVFAPNGLSNPGRPRFEDYYPGDAYVDVVAFSAYNFGNCEGGPWQEPDVVFNNNSPRLGMKYGYFLDRMTALAPTKPLFIAETGTSSYKTPGVSNPSEKNRWLQAAYQYLAARPNVKAVLYFNINEKDCDLVIFNKSGVQYTGYRSGLINNKILYAPPEQLLFSDHVVP